MKRSIKQSGNQSICSGQTTIHSQKNRAKTARITSAPSNGRKWTAGQKRRGSRKPTTLEDGTSFMGWRRDWMSGWR